MYTYNNLPSACQLGGRVSLISSDFRQEVIKVSYLFIIEGCNYVLSA